VAGKKSNYPAVLSFVIGIVLFVTGIGIAAFDAGAGVLLIIVGLALVVVARPSGVRMYGGRGNVQRPASGETAFSPPPLPDTVVVKCQFCGTSQPFRENCVQCGAPLPRP
jgi:hypothetical protein